MILRPTLQKVTLGCLSLIISLVVLSSPVLALTTPQTVERGGPAYEATTSCTSSSIVTESIYGDADQIANAKTIIGIAKTYKLGQPGARIGLITALVESNLRILSNTNVPASLDYPDVQGSGSDHDSVGIMQQRPSTGWSTFGSGTSKEIVWQLMDPAYAAQAFFGTPPGAKLADGQEVPRALKKGLQNLSPAWETREPGSAAQAVQISAFPDRYNQRITDANNLLGDLWDASPPLPLPIPIDGISTGENGCLTGEAIADMMTVIKKYAWPVYCHKNAARCDGYANPRIPTPDYARAIGTALSNDKYIGSRCPDKPGTTPLKDSYIETMATRSLPELQNPSIVENVGLDCGSFVTRVMIDSGADPEYNKYQSNTAGQLEYLQDYSEGNSKGNPARYKKLAPSEPLQPGDIAVQNNKSIHHTYLYVGDLADFKGKFASASQCERAGMASSESDNDRFTYEWFRLIVSPSPSPTPTRPGGPQPL